MLLHLEFTLNLSTIIVGFFNIKASRKGSLTMIEKNSKAQVSKPTSFV